MLDQDQFQSCDFTHFPRQSFRVCHRARQPSGTWIPFFDLRRRQLVHRPDEELVLLEEGAHALEELGAQALGARDLRAVEREAILDVPDDGVLEQRAVGLEQRREALREGDRAQRLEGLGRAAEVRAGLLDDAAYAELTK